MTADRLDDLLAEPMARVMAHFRVPPSTVYMDGSHNPSDAERRHAKREAWMLCDAIRAALRDGTLRCGAKVKERGWTCTLIVGHDGPHIERIDYRSWPQEAPDA